MLIGGLCLHLPDYSGLDKYAAHMTLAMLGTNFRGGACVISRICTRMLQNFQQAKAFFSLFRMSCNT